MDLHDIKFNPSTLFLVTGGAGFIGSNLCEKILRLGYRVRCFDNLSTGKLENMKDFINHPNFEFIQGDIRDFESCMTATKNVDYVLHQAAWGSVPRSIELPLIYEEINIKGTLNMLEAARLAKVKRFVYASSSSVYGDEPNLPKVEGKEGNLLSPYALTKKVNEEYAKMYTKLYGLETIGLRYFNVFGKRQNPEGDYAAVIPKFINCLLNGKSPVINGDGMQSRDFTYIENVISANILSCVSHSNSTGQVYNIATGGRETIIDVYYTICKSLNKQIEPVFTDVRKGDIRHSNADISKAQKYLGYKPNYDIATGLELSIDWYKSVL